MFARLEPLLPLVRKPIQYVGGELNSVVKDWDAAEVRWALMYPDAYEVGIPNQGVQILYEVLNERPGVLAERTYSVWPDLEHLMRENAVPQFTVEAHRPVRDFDVFGISFATELGYTNLLTALDLAGIPLAAAERDERDPVVLAGGHAAFNPEPIAEFIDGAVLGDGEQAVLAITEADQGLEAGGPPRWQGRAAAAAGGRGRGVRPALLRRRLPARRPDPAGRAEPAGRAAHRRQAHGHGPGQLGLPAPSGGAAARVGARAVQRRDLPRLHPRLPVLPGRHDHPAGPRAEHHHDRGHGRAGGDGQRFRRGRPAVAVQRRPQRDQRDREGPGRPLRGRQPRAVPAVHPGGRVQRHARQRTRPRRPPVRPHVRPRGRDRADAQGDQQDGHRGRPHPDRHHRLRERLAPGQALLHVRPADRDRRGRGRHRGPRQEGHQGRPGGERPPGHPVHGVDRGLRAQAAHPVPVGRPGRRTRRWTHGCAASAPRCAPTPGTGARWATATTTGGPRSSRACCPAATGGSPR